MTARIGSLCSGYGGLDLAVMDAVPGAEVAWHAQYEPPDKNGKPDMHQWAARILEHRFPGVPNHGDITAIDYTTVEPVDILTAGFPCQDISLAGGRAGLLAGNRSGLWVHVARAIAELRPSLVFIENVRTLTSARAHSDLESCPRCVGDGKHRPALRALGAVLGDLAGLGFDAEWVCLPASGVEAPHQRERAFVLAWPADADADELGRYRRPGDHTEAHGGDEPAHGGDTTSSPNRIALMPTPKASDGPHGGPNQRDASGRYYLPGVAVRLPNGHAGEWTSSDGTDYGPAVRRWEAAIGSSAPCPTEPGERSGRRLAPAFAEWMMGLPAAWVTGVPGIPRSAQLKALGNGVMPQQGAEAFRILIERATAAPVSAEIPTPAAVLTGVPLFQELPVSPTTSAPLGAPPAWLRVVQTRAAGQCECTGHCGVAHSRTAGRCPKRHGAYAKNKRRPITLILAPKKPPRPAHIAAALPDDQLMAWCEECLAKAEKLAATP